MLRSFEEQSESIWVLLLMSPFLLKELLELLDCAPFHCKGLICWCVYPYWIAETFCRLPLPWNKPTEKKSRSSRSVSPIASIAYIMLGHHLEVNKQKLSTPEYLINIFLMFIVIAILLLLITWGSHSAVSTTVDDFNIITGSDEENTWFGQKLKEDAEGLITLRSSMTCVILHDTHVLWVLCSMCSMFNHVLGV